jgi:hypothetical protein
LKGTQHLPLQKKHRFRIFKWTPNHINLFKLCFVGVSCGLLRQYTYRFARNLIQLFPGMVEEKHHESLPPVHCTFSPTFFILRYGFKSTGSHIL